MAHHLKLLNKMCKYKMDPTSIVEVTDLTRFCPQTDGQTDRRTDDMKPVCPPFNFIEAGVQSIIFKFEFEYKWEGPIYLFSYAIVHIIE